MHRSGPAPATHALGALIPQGGLPAAQTCVSAPCPPPLVYQPAPRRVACTHSEARGVGCTSPPKHQTPARQARQKKPAESILVVEDQGQVFWSFSFGEHQRLRDGNSTGWPPVMARECGGRRLAGISAEPQLRAPFWEVATPGLQAVWWTLGYRDNPQGLGLRPGGS